MTTQFHDQPLDDQALDQVFREARSYNGWLDKDVSEAQIEAIYDLLKMAPTSANMHPARFVWVKSAEEKKNSPVSLPNKTRRRS
jgi:3-hydroxypropanoate dehydrogenase